jgi:hypothetical protein
MTRRRFASPAAILVLALGLAGCVGGTYRVEPLAAPLASAQPPEYAVGDEFVYSIDPIEDIHRVVAVDAKNVVFESSRIFGRITQPKAFSNPVNFTGGSFATLYEVTLTTDLSGLFPLEVGKSVAGSGTGRFAAGTVMVTHRCGVARQERIVVKAGAFDAFVVDCQMQTDRGTGFRNVYWYAPEIGHFAGVDRGGRFHELVRYSRAPR